jgi:hypothetical protein
MVVSLAFVEDVGVGVKDVGVGVKDADDALDSSVDGTTFTHALCDAGFGVSGGFGIGTTDGNVVVGASSVSIV